MTQGSKRVEHLPVGVMCIAAAWIWEEKYPRSGQLREGGAEPERQFSVRLIRKEHSENRNTQ